MYVLTSASFFAVLVPRSNQHVIVESRETDTERTRESERERESCLNLPCDAHANEGVLLSRAVVLSSKCGLRFRFVSSGQTDRLTDRQTD